MNTLTKAGRYDLREELGRGAMGVVFHGFDPVIGRRVAVKTLRLSEAGTGLSRDELIGRFQTEARAAGLLTHPNIVVVFDAGEEDGLFYITMEFVEGRSLQTLIDAHQPFPVSRVLKIMEQVCSALDFAHQHNVVHRDIKPANLMLTSDDVVKITDFGTAKILQFGTAQTAHVMGTPSYMSPEQVKGKPVDGRSDIFSLGVILYELMTGEKPFPGQNITTVIYKIINEEPVSPRSLDSSIHPGLSAVISRALAKDPGARYQSCHELLSALKNYHEMMSPDVTTRVTPVVSKPAPVNRATAPVNRATAPPIPRVAASPMLATAQDADQVQFMLSTGIEQESRKRTGGWLLALILVGVIGYAGYRVYPPILDLWRLAHASAETLALMSKADTSAPQTTNPENSNAVPAAQQPSDAPPPAVVASTTAAAAEASTPQPAEQAPPVAAAKPAEPAVAPASSADPSPTVPPKPAVTAPASPARLLESKLRKELAGQPIAEKLKIQATPTALTLSGTISLAEHRELLGHLRTVPADVRIIDDTEYAEDQNQKGTTASASSGWIWIRSVPPGAQIFVDGVDTHLHTPVSIELQAGQHEVRLMREGFGAAQRNVVVNRGQTMQFTQTLAAE